MPATEKNGIVGSMPTMSETAASHREADAACGRDWLCQCAACRRERRLIAAATALLLACRSALAWLEHIDDGDTAQAIRLRAAIAQAEKEG